MTQCEVAVIGGGIAGLACARELADNGVDVRVLEAERRVGGAAETRRCGELLIERGPSTVRSSPELEDLTGRVGLELEHARRAPPYVVSGGRLVRVPPSPRDLLRGMPLPLRSWAGILAEPFRTHPPGPRSVYTFAEQRFGSTVAASMADVMTLGVYGAPASQVGFESAFPELADRLDRYGSLFRTALAGFRRRAQTAGGLVSTAQGIGAIPECVARSLGERVCLERPVEGVNPREDGFELSLGGEGDSGLLARSVVLAIPPARAARIITDDRVRSILGSYRSTPQTLAAFTVDRAACAREWAGFGFLAPTREHLPLLGGLFQSALFPGRAPEGVLLVAVFVGPSLVDATDSVLAAEIAPVLGRLLEMAKSPELVDVARHPQGITLYDPEHRDRTRTLRAELTRLKGAHIAGAAYDGVGFGRAVASGFQVARTLLGEPA